MTNKELVGLGGCVLLAAMLQAPAGAQGRGPDFQGGPPPFPGGFPGGPGPSAERKLVAQFDKNGDKRLDATERKAARESLAADTSSGPGPGCPTGRHGACMDGGPGGPRAGMARVRTAEAALANHRVTF